MPQVSEITVQKIWQPGEGKKWGNVQSVEGDRYFGPPALLKQFNEREVCKLEWEGFGTDGTGKKIVKKLFTTLTAPKQITRPSTSSSDSRQIFRTALLKEFIRAGKVDLATTDLVQAIGIIDDAYNRTNNPQWRDDMQDEIPV